MKREVTLDEMQDTMNRIVTMERFKHVQDVRYGYDDGRIVIFVKDDGTWFKLHCDLPNPQIVKVLKDRPKN